MPLVAQNGTVEEYGDVLPGPWICLQSGKSKSAGIFFGDDPFAFPLPQLLMQLSVCSILGQLMYLILSPMGETKFISQMLTGIAIGPTIAGRARFVAKDIFPPDSIYISQTVSVFGCMLYLFIVGVKTDLTLISKTGKKSVIIGLCTFFIPLLITLAFSNILRGKYKMSPDLHGSLFYIGSFQSINSFYVIADVLTDLNLLSSEVGRLAMSSSIVSGLCSWAYVVIVFSMKVSGLTNRPDTLLWMGLCVGCLMIFILYVLRPIMFWMIRHTVEGKPIRENYVLGSFLMVLGCAFFGEAIGQHLMFGPMILGVAIPDGSSLGSALVFKLDSFVTSILLPSYIVPSGSLINLSDTDFLNVWIVFLLAVCAMVGKLLGAMIPSLYWKMPPLEALSLGLILSSKGITDVLIVQNAATLYMLDADSRSITIATMVMLTALITPIIKLLYKPSLGYKSYKRRTIQHSRHDAELRLLSCIHHQENTPSIISLLTISNPSQKSPICFYVVHLLELAGRSSPVLISHRPGKRNSYLTSQSDSMIQAFRTYESQNPGVVLVSLFTAMSPYSSMHDEICILALEKRVSMVILPFHKQNALHGPMNQSANQIRTVNRHILRRAPCSVGILVDRGTLNRTLTLNPITKLYRVGIIFLGGADDREALAYAMRMAENPNNVITVARIVDQSSSKVKHSSDDKLDFQILNEFRVLNNSHKQHVFNEEIVIDSVGVVNVTRSMEKFHDLILVGRRHNFKSELFAGFTEWNEFPELGFIGDMLASSDSKKNCVSVLVVQQQSFVGDEVPDSVKFRCVDNSNAVVDIPDSKFRLNS